MVGFFIYSDTEPREQHGFRGGSKVNPHNAYNKHLYNWFYLTFLCRNTTDLAERFQLTKEIVICNRKLDYWYKKAEFDPNNPIVTEQLRILKSQWQFAYSPNEYTPQQIKWLKEKKIDYLAPGER